MEATVLHCVDADSRTRAELARAAFALGYHAEVYGSIEELAQHAPEDGIVIARDDPSRGGISEALDVLERSGVWLSVIAMGDAPSAARIVAAVKAGALDYLSLPLDRQRFAATLRRVGEEARRAAQLRRRMIEARARIADLTTREREVLDQLTEGASNKAIARALAISPRTVEIHRANMMGKLGARHPADAVRLRIEARLEPPIAG
ncbi:helix-turn-helix transcriptional regulator [Erythrobacter sp. 3-20A1M]|uniref:response regulator transcription factor n=1 Tax=Erythrobacter sp. 3-20A1M TaxID=2653850 RepID=UPI001BFBF6F0|nr:LuxR C-terminal-related transcriptional regulator [Erythrobacter sp. 3-20A1M]QWC56085.1 helix-turn-helix transcriptional regulator [Erythrobacter sp. 3-20A1M]